jgi:hypothetical protein
MRNYLGPTKAVPPHVNGPNEGPKRPDDRSGPHGPSVSHAFVVNGRVVQVPNPPKKVPKSRQTV